jgi:flagellar biogenesis protein FliO
MDVVRQSLAITFVLLLLWAAVWFLRRRQSGGIGFSAGRTKTGLLEPRAKLALTAQHSVHLVRIGDRDLALAVHPSGVTLLCDLTPPAAGKIGPGAGNP